MGELRFDPTETLAVRPELRTGNDLRPQVLGGSLQERCGAHPLRAFISARFHPAPQREPPLEVAVLAEEVAKGFVDELCWVPLSQRPGSAVGSNGPQPRR